MNVIVRQIVLDTETTGMNKEQPYYKGHRVIEIGAVEIINRRLTNRFFHTYLNPGCSIDQEAFNVHGITERFLNDKPKFSEIANEFLNFISGSELIVHNASFDISFLDNECFMLKTNLSKIISLCKVTDTLQLARKLFPGKKNSLNALCERYYIDNSMRTFHNALLDAKLLANIYLLMTGGQISMFFMGDDFKSCIDHDVECNKQVSCKSEEKIFSSSLRVIYANSDEVKDHEQYLNVLEKNSKGFCIWRNRC